MKIRQRAGTRGLLMREQITRHRPQKRIPRLARRQAGNREENQDQSPEANANRWRSGSHSNGVFSRRIENGLMRFRAQCITAARNLITGHFASTMRNTSDRHVTTGIAIAPGCKNYSAGQPPTPSNASTRASNSMFAGWFWLSSSS